MFHSFENGSIQIPHRRKLILALIPSKRPCRFDFVMIALSKVSSIKLSRHSISGQHCKDATDDIAQILRDVRQPIVRSIRAFLQIR